MTALRVLHCDNHLLVVYKPGGVPVQADASGDLDLLTMGKAWIGRQFSKPGAVYLGLVHRLDRPARGVVVFGRTSKAAARLSQQFRERGVEKAYRAVVCGQPPAAAGHLTHWLETDQDGARVVPERHGKLASLDYRVVERLGPLALCEIDLHTGRKHQIRAQLSAIGCPILGDVRYGAPSPLPDRCIALLAAHLTLDHPTTKERLNFFAPEPPGWPWLPIEPR